MWICMRSLEVSKFIYNAGLFKNNRDFKKVNESMALGIEV